MRIRILAAPALAALALFVAACGSSGETLIVTDRPQPVGPAMPDDTPAPVAPVVAGLDTVALSPFPAGRMWTFDAIPTAYFQERYGFAPDSAWLNPIRRATIRLPNCTASFISEDGLALTNHHCVRDQVSRLDGASDSLLRAGFVADSIRAALEFDDLYADQLISITDVTRRIRARIDHLVDDDRRAEVMDNVLESTEEQLTAEAKQRDTTRHVEIVSLFSGARYAAYTFRRIHDLRLVMVPEHAVGRFGGDTHNFSYPRYTLDFALLRAFDENGEPLSTPDHFRISDAGVEEGDVVFSAGNPGATHRFRTFSQLQYERDFDLPAELAVLGARAAAIQQFIAQYRTEADSFEVESTLLSLRNVQKDARGRLEALNDPDFMRRVQALEVHVDSALAGRDTLQRAFREGIRSIQAVQRTKRAAASQAAPFALFGSELIDSHILIRAVYAYLYDFTIQRGAPPEYVAQYRSSGKNQKPLPLELEKALLAARLREFQEHLGPMDPTVQTILAGSTPEARAAEIVGGTALVDSVGFDSLLDRGYLSSNDPTVPLVQSMVPLYLTVAEQQRSIATREERLMGRIAEARIAADANTAPDGTFTLRLTDGVVEGYGFNGTLAPPNTTFLGMFDAHFSYDLGSDFALPESWFNLGPDFDPETPLNFVATIDMTGGSSGSPVFKLDRSLVGVAFDSNTEALGNVYLYQDGAGRGIIVDARAIMETLRDVYDADALVAEIESGTMAASD
ncbi:MAG TPA: S46 family peptidase [Rhodothermales bacterium]